MSTTIDAPRTPARPRRRVNWEKWGWLYMRASGVLLVVLIFGHLLVNLFLIVIGMFLEGPVAILIVAPILLEVVKQFGMSPVQFGVMLSFNTLVGMITPPMGIGLFVGAKVAGTTPEKVLRASLPFFIPLLAGLMIISFVPAVTTWLPDLVMGKAR